MSRIFPKAAHLFAVLILAVPPCAAQEVDFEYKTGMFAELPHERGELLADEFPEYLPVTTDDPTAEKFFQQGMEQLYAGYLTEALRSFREVITRDPDCAMGYWGIAVCHHDRSLQTEYMWYASERKGNVATDLERQLIDIYNEHLGTATQPEMIVVEPETGKRRARPVVRKMNDELNSQNRLYSKLRRLGQSSPKSLPLFFLYVPHMAEPKDKMPDWFEHPIAPRLAEWHTIPERHFTEIFETSRIKNWHVLGRIFWKQWRNPATARLAWNTARRVDNQWLKKHDAVPYERSGYRRLLATLVQTSDDEDFRQRMTKTLDRLPKHPGDNQFIPDPKRLWPRVGDAETDVLPTESQKAAMKTLGPLEWTPPALPEFSLPRGKANGKLGSTDFDGPTIVVFYLGFGCIHCVEQLNELRPRYQDFKDAGLEIVTIGVDPVDRVRAAILDSIEVDGPQTPFEILCDVEGDVFKKFHCWDEFTDEALHGTFLVDSQGRILWRDISEEPFMDTDFLLKESKRLISLWDSK